TCIASPVQSFLHLLHLLCFTNRQLHCTPLHAADHETLNHPGRSTAAPNSPPQPALVRYRFHLRFPPTSIARHLQTLPSPPRSALSVPNLLPTSTWRPSYSTASTTAGRAQLGDGRGSTT
ncbi:hypothetical protein KC19_12G092800, partial [Ceratodon purpureus]